MNRVYPHKFGWGYKPRAPLTQPRGILWVPHRELKYPPIRDHDYKWSINAQENITIDPGTTKTFLLNFGVTIALGVVLVSLTNELKQLGCTLSNESVAESCDNIVISILNNSKTPVSINEGTILCSLTYVNLYVNL